MCRKCDYEKMLQDAALEPTSNRLRVLEVVGGQPHPLSAGDIYRTLRRAGAINRVTVYRILERLVARGVIERLSTGGRAFYYGLAPNAHHRPHAHFYCTRCGHMDCLEPDSLGVDTDQFQTTFAGRIDKIEVRVDGICKNCLRRETAGRLHPKATEEKERRTDGTDTTGTRRLHRQLA